MARRGINKVIILGSLGNDPEVRYLPNGDAVTNFSIATSEEWTDKQTGELKKITEWHRCIAFKKPGEILGQYLRKGHKVYIEGSIRTRKWQDQNGNDRYSTEIIVDQFELLTPKPADSPQQSAPARQAQQQSPQPDYGNFDDEQIPF